MLAVLAAVMVAAAATAQDQPKIVGLSPNGAGPWEQGKGTTKTFYYYKSKLIRAWRPASGPRTSLAGS